MGMTCAKHNFNGEYQCEHCELEILDKIEQNEIKPEDLPKIQEIRYWIDKRIFNSLGMNN